MQNTIPSPCTESWDCMTSTKEGRFCQSCEKTVVDFTRMSDAELLAHPAWQRVTLRHCV